MKMLSTAPPGIPLHLMQLHLAASGFVAPPGYNTEGWPPVATARGALERIEDRGVVSKETVCSLSGAVGLRNVVAHGYSGVDPARIHTAATTGLADLERFAAEVSAWVERQAAR